MGQPILLESVQERLGHGLQVGLPHHYDALKVLMHAARLDVGTNGDVGEVAWPGVSVDAVEATVEQIIEALMNAVRLAHDYSVTFSS